MPLQEWLILVLFCVAIPAAEGLTLMVVLKQIKKDTSEAACAAGWIKSRASCADVQCRSNLHVFEKNHLVFRWELPWVHIFFNFLENTCPICGGTDTPGSISHENTLITSDISVFSWDHCRLWKVFKKYFLRRQNSRVYSHCADWLRNYNGG